MNQTHQLRLLFEYTYTQQIRTNAPHAPSMLPFLAVPIKERLTLLALYDSASMEECKASLPWMKETDYRLTSHRIHAALQILLAAMDEPTCWINPGSLPEHESTKDLGKNFTPFPVPDRCIPRDTGKQLRQALFPSASLMLFGHLVPAAVAELSLQQRVCLYLLVVEEYSWLDIQTLTGCSKRRIDHTLKEACEALGGDEPLDKAIQATGGK